VQKRRPILIINEEVCFFAIKETHEIHAFFTARVNDLIEDINAAEKHINALNDKMNGYGGLSQQQKAFFGQIIMNDCAGALHNVVRVKNNIDNW
jgi:hypothetical protein